MLRRLWFGILSWSVVLYVKGIVVHHRAMKDRAVLAISSVSSTLCLSVWLGYWFNRKVT